MSEILTLAQIDETADAVKKKISHKPKIGMILGSGLGKLADAVENPQYAPYPDIPNWPISTVWGHTGQLVAGQLEGQEVLVMQGRSHFYEGYSISLVGLPIRVMKRLGIETLILTNAAGAVNREYVPGDLMLIQDHINFIGMVGASPLMGPNLDEFGPRFPDMSQVYDRELLDVARASAVAAEIDMKEGVYGGLSGPQFETPAELRFLQAIGVDGVGMSTVSEATVARHSGMRVLGISGISNKANLDGSTITTHEEVIEAGEILVPRLEAVVRGVLQRI
jgi:purine-nucleoside phosphorylase